MNLNEIPQVAKLDEKIAEAEKKLQVCETKENMFSLKTYTLDSV